MDNSDPGLEPDKVDFANILFAGPCNRACPWCIGKELPAFVNVNNLNLYPLRNLDGFVDLVNELRITQVVFTGTVSDPQLYRHEARLLEYLRGWLNHNPQYSVHTNGVAALSRIDTFNLYDKACISFPSFTPGTYGKLMGISKVPDLARIIECSRIPVKVSCVINDHNQHEIPSFLARCNEIGVRRVVLRRLVRDYLDRNPFGSIKPKRYYRNNPVYILDEMEVTYWEFDSSTSTSINLFPDGTLGTSYLLKETAQFNRELQ